MPSHAAAVACRMLITGTMRRRKSGRSGTMSGLEGLSQARRDGGRSCRSQGPAWRRLRGGMERGGAQGPGRELGGSLSLAPTPERTPFSVGGAREDRELLQAHYPKKGPSSLPRAEEEASHSWSEHRVAPGMISALTPGGPRPLTPSPTLQPAPGPAGGLPNTPTCAE